MKLLAAVTLALSLTSIPKPAPADTAYFLYFTTYNPYSQQLVGGPYASYGECARIMNLEGYQPGGSYSCQVRAY